MSKLLLSAAISAVLLATTASADAKVISRKTFSKYKYQDCGAFNVCVLHFGAVPAKHTYIIQSVTCNARILAASAPISYLRFDAYNASPKTYGSIFMTPEAMSSVGSSTYFAASSSGIVKAPATAQLDVLIQVAIDADVDFIECSIGGTDLKHS